MIDRIFDNLEDAQLEIDELLQVQNNTVTLLFCAASPLVPAAAEAIRKRNPAINLRLFQGEMPDSESLKPDLTLFSSPCKIPADNHFLLMTEPIGVAIPVESPLASAPSFSLDDLRGKTFLSLGEQSDLAQEVEYYLRNVDFQPQTSTIVNSPNVLRDLLRVDLGYAFIPAISWTNFSDGSLTFRIIDDFPMERHLYLAWDGDRFQNEAVRTARETIEKSFRAFAKAHRGFL